MQTRQTTQAGPEENRQTARLARQERSRAEPPRRATSVGERGDSGLREALAGKERQESMLRQNLSAADADRARLRQSLEEAQLCPCHEIRSLQDQIDAKQRASRELKAEIAQIETVKSEIRGLEDTVGQIGSVVL